MKHIKFLLLRISLLNYKYKSLKWIICGGAIIAAIGGIILYRAASAQYYYIDWNNQQGVATHCWERKDSLYCNRAYGGTIKVQQYWRDI